MKNEGTIRHYLPDGSSVLIPFSRYMSMDEVDFSYINAGMTGRYSKIPEHVWDYKEREPDELDIEEVEVDDTLDIDPLYDDEDTV